MIDKIKKWAESPEGKDAIKTTAFIGTGGLVGVIVNKLIGKKGLGYDIAAGIVGGLGGYGMKRLGDPDVNANIENNSLESKIKTIDKQIQEAEKNDPVTQKQEKTKKEEQARQKYSQPGRDPIIVDKGSGRMWTNNREMVPVYDKDGGIVRYKDKKAPKNEKTPKTLIDAVIAKVKGIVDDTFTDALFIPRTFTSPELLKKLEERNKLQRQQEKVKEQGLNKKSSALLNKEAEGVQISENALTALGDQRAEAIDRYKQAQRDAVKNTIKTGVSTLSPYGGILGLDWVWRHIGGTNSAQHLVSNYGAWDGKNVNTEKLRKGLISDLKESGAPNIQKIQKQYRKNPFYNRYIDMTLTNIQKEIPTQHPERRFLVPRKSPLQGSRKKVMKEFSKAIKQLHANPHNKVAPFISAKDFVEHTLNPLSRYVKGTLTTPNTISPDIGKSVRSMNPWMEKFKKFGWLPVVGATLWEAFANKDLKLAAQNAEDADKAYREALENK